MKNVKTKAKTIAILVVSFVVFAGTFFALAENRNGNPLFLDSDQDGLTDQEEKMLGTDPYNPDTDGDGYTDKKEIESGYNPLKKAPGDKLAGTTEPSSQKDDLSQSETAGQQEDLTDEQLNDLLSADAIADLSSDPENPNLTNEMIGQLLQLTKDKAGTSETFAENPTFSADDLSQITQGALETVDIAKNLPEIKDSELNILPPVEGKKLSEEKIIARQKEEIEKYLAQAAFIFASNAPFPVEQPENLESQISAESANFFSAYTAGDKTKIDSYAAKAQTGIDQLKKLAVPYVLKENHKSILQLAIYTLDQKDDIVLNASDPLKSLAAASSLQAVAQKAMELQNQFSQVLSDYGIEFVNFP